VSQHFIIFHLINCHFINSHNDDPYFIISYCVTHKITHIKWNIIVSQHFIISHLINCHFNISHNDTHNKWYIIVLYHLIMSQKFKNWNFKFKSVPYDFNLLWTNMIHIVELWYILSKYIIYILSKYDTWYQNMTYLFNKIYYNIQKYYDRLVCICITKVMS
jgi:hypothetical protein